ncbi:MAG: hypothetical protein HXO06_00705 [Prevotella salivae]|uniref:hypothetical protein n=1 Tax=Segatella salivae TaxID=228604 RepID=UPI001CB39AED|nr:hypothetical protein [Segatella salivae]MBF1543697.1 hypothetical protein [Segatella salivae]
MNYYTKPTPQDFRNLEKKHDTAFNRGYLKGVLHGMILLSIILLSILAILHIVNDKNLQYDNRFYKFSTVTKTEQVEYRQVFDKSGKLVEEYKVNQ